ncbi:MAG: prolyl oligopeptidase family serine peptidase [Flavobacterium micromati]|nr:prolyl oligopeptidase family serine peptidase [Flavobacterium micromati]
MIILKNSRIINRRPYLFLLIIIVSLFNGFTCNAQFKYPTARKEAFDSLIHGRKLIDDYFWMSRKNNEKEVTEFSRQQSKLTQTIFDSIPGDSIIEKEWNDAFTTLDDELWNGETVGEYIYYSRVIPKEGMWYCRRKGLNGAEEKVLSSVKINGQRYSIQKRVFAHSKSLLALMLTQQGEANPQIRIYDIDKKEFLIDSIAPVMFNDSRGVSMTWLPDDKGILYSQAPPTEIHEKKYYNGMIKLHMLGNAVSKDEIVFGIDQNPQIKLQPHETPYIYSFRNSSYLVARIRAGDNDNYAFAVHYTKLSGKNTPWKKLKNYTNLGDGFDANGNYLYAGTKDTPGYNIVKINLETGASPEAFWQQENTVIAVTDNNHNSGIIAGKDVLYVLTRKIGDMRIIKIDLKTKSASVLPLKFRSSINSLSLSGANDLLFASFSATRSVQYFLYVFKSKETLSVPFADKVCDAGEFLQTDLMWVPSRDGKRIPASLVYKKGLDLTNNNPLLIDGYGNGGAVTDLGYDPNKLPWIMRGGIYAVAHVRGGGELGEEWVKDGQFPNKMNSINDAVDVAEYFVKNNYTSANKQLIMGASAGSFLVGNAINQRPDLFAGGIFLSGLPDLVTNMDAAGGREQKSTGPLATKEGFNSRYSISAYYNIPQNNKLPAMLILHGATDYILSMHPVARYTAKLQEMQKGNRPILLSVDWNSGHGGSQSELLYILKFALWQTGHPDFQLK